MVERTPTAPASLAFALWYREPRRPGTRREWELLGHFATEREAWGATVRHLRGSGDYLVLPAGREP